MPNKIPGQYDVIAEWYDRNRSREFFEKNYIEQALKGLPACCSVLDLGCGMAEPIGSYLVANGYAYSGLDGSSKLLALAKQRLPSGTFIDGDMIATELPVKYHLVIAWNSLFHLSATDQVILLEKIALLLELGGRLLFTSGTEEGEVWSDNNGENLYHASLSTNAYKNHLSRLGFEIKAHVTKDAQCGGATVWLSQYCGKS